MGKAFRDEAVVDLPRVSNNVGHGSLRLAHRVKSFQKIDPLWVLHIANYKFNQNFQCYRKIVSFQPPAEKISRNIQAIYR